MTHRPAGSPSRWMAGLGQARPVAGPGRFGYAGAMDIEDLDARYADLLRILREPDAPGASINLGIAGILRIQDGIEPEGPVPDYAGDLLDAMRLVPVGTWFRWSHLGFEVVPNRPMAGGAWSNALDHHAEDGPREGAPIGYESMAFDSPDTRRALPRHVCAAAMMARRASVLKELARRDGRHRVVQTGQGPLVATPEGRLAELPARSYLTADGRIVPHDPALHGDARIEAPYA